MAIRRSRGRPVRGHSPGAFSLIELLVVLAIGAMLMGILMPSIRRSMQRATATVCMHHLHEIDQALQTYRLDHRGWLPDVDDPPPGAPVDPYGAAWFGRLVPRYIRNPSLLVCPADPARGLTQPGAPLDRHPDPANASSYGMNDLIRQAGLANLDRTSPARPLETILLADAGPDVPVMHGTVDDVGSVWHRSGGRMRWDDDYHPGLSGLRQSWLTGRHAGSINLLTVGGAVSSVHTHEMMQEKICSYYGAGAAGGCPLCQPASIPHYSFATARLFWWTGPLPSQ